MELLPASLAVSTLAAQGSDHARAAVGDANSRLSLAQGPDTGSRALWQYIDDSNDLLTNTARARLSTVVGYFGDRTLVAWPGAPKEGLSGQ